MNIFLLTVSETLIIYAKFKFDKQAMIFGGVSRFLQ